MNSEALSSRWLPLILLFGAPPPHPHKRDEPDVDLQTFGNYIHDLAKWTNEVRDQYMKWEGIMEHEWGNDYNRCKREAFDHEFIDWAYTLKPEEYNEPD